MIQRNSSETFIHGTGSLAQYEFDGDDYDRYYLAMRAIIRLFADLNQGRKSSAVIPGTVLDGTISFLNQILHPNDFSQENIFRTDDSEYLLWQNISNSHLPDFINWIQSNQGNSQKVGLFPYASAPDYWNTFNQLENSGLQVFSNMDKITPKEIFNPSHFMHKGAYYPWIGNTATQQHEQSFSFIPMPQGIVAQNPENLLKALDEMKVKLGGDKAVVLKQIFGGGGYGINFFNTITEAKHAVLSGNYNFEVHPYDETMLHPVLVQEALDIVEDEHGEVGLSVQFDGQNIVSITRTLSDGHGHWSGNIIIDAKNPPNSLQPQQIVQTQKISQQLLRKIQPQGRGGIDFLLTNNNGKQQVTFIEVNGARTTGAEEAIKFGEIVSQAKQRGVIGLYKYTIDPNKRLTAQDIYELLRKNRIAFSIKNNEPQYGLLPIICVGDHLTVTGYASNSEELLKLFQMLQNKL